MQFQLIIIVGCNSLSSAAAMRRFLLTAVALALMLFIGSVAAAQAMNHMPSGLPSAALPSGPMQQLFGYRRMLRAQLNHFLESYTANNPNNTQPSPSPHLAEGCYTEC